VSDDPVTHEDELEPPERRCVAPGVDAAGQPIPKDLRDLFDAEFLLDSLHHLKQIARLLDDAKGWLNWLKPETHAEIQQVIRRVEDAIPHEVCRHCGGKQCGECLMSGYHPKFSCVAGHNTSKPKEEKPTTKPKSKPAGKGKKGAA
jgi:hypothetical protein